MGKILVVDDEEVNVTLLSRRLQKLGYDVREARHGVAALQLLEVEEFDLLLLDVMMPQLDGFEVARRVRAHPTRHQGTQIIFLSAKNSIDAKLEGLKIGAVDYLTKPFDFRELQAKVKCVVENANRRKTLEKAAYTDFLTGLSNRRHLEEQMSALMQRHVQHPFEMWMLLLDLDFFKRINDTFGHDQGDFVIVEVARILRESVAEHDLVGRFGGEEFLLLFVGRTRAEVVAEAEQIRQRVAQRTFLLSGVEERVTISIGVCPYREGTLADWIANTDQALYQAKKNGRNRVEEP